MNCRLKVKMIVMYIAFENKIGYKSDHSKTENMKKRI